MIVLNLSHHSRLRENYHCGVIVTLVDKIISSCVRKRDIRRCKNIHIKSRMRFKSGIQEIASAIQTSAYLLLRTPLCMSKISITRLIYSHTHTRKRKENRKPASLGVKDFQKLYSGFRFTFFYLLRQGCRPFIRNATHLVLAFDYLVTTLSTCHYLLAYSLNGIAAGSNGLRCNKKKNADPWLPELCYHFMQNPYKY